MIKSFRGLRGEASLALALAAAALMVTACSNSAGGGTPPPTQSVAQRRPLPPPSPIPFVYDTVDYPSASITEVTGINDHNGIIGTYETSSSGVQSFTAGAPSYKTFSKENFNAASVVMQSTAFVNAATTKEAGWAVNPNGQGKGTYGLIHDPNGNWDTLRKVSEGKGCIFMQLFGINEAGVAVGYFTPSNASGGCTPTTLLYSLANNNYTTGLGPTSGTAVITGINNLADLVGYVQPATGNPVEGWYMLCNGGGSNEGCTGSSYGPVQYFALNSEPTTLNGINDNRLAVGTVAGSGSTSQGFIANLATGSSSVQYIDAGGNGASSSTFLNGINNNNYICGWYAKAGTSNYQGFVGIPVVIGNDRKRRSYGVTEK